MPAGEHKYIVDQGATFQSNLVYRDSNNALVNLTGYTARMQVRQTLESSNYVLSLTTENGGITLGGAAGTISLLATATAMTSIVAGSYVYDLEVVSAGGIVDRLMMGAFVVRGEVTR